MSYGKYGSNDYWQYLHAFSDHSTGMTEFITYLTGDNNTHGTPNTGTDNRFDPTYCTIRGGCSGSFANQDDHAWSEQLVSSITIAPTDTNSSSLPSAETTYSYGMATQSGATCAADSAGLTACPVATWYPSGENDWQDYYHGEFRGFSWVYIVSPAGDLTTQNYASTPGWGTTADRSANYTAGQLYEQDLYQGSNDNPSTLISKTSNTYGGNNGGNSSCYADSSYTAYVPCETVLTSSRTTDYEQTGSGNANAPWVQHDYTYDDYSTVAGSGISSSPQSPAKGAYHNLQQEVISSSNAPTVTKKWTYYTTDEVDNGQTFYNVHQVAHSELDDAGGHAWSCQDITYDEGVVSPVPQPAAGWPTTTKDYSNCGNHAAGKTLTSHVGYDSSGQVVATVDAVATTNPALYSGAGCTLATAPAILSSNWGEGYYTSCAVYDGQSGLPTKQTNAFGQTSTTSYDATQGQVPVSTKDVNGQTTTLAYTYPGGNPLVQSKLPGESGSFTDQSQTVSTCTDNSLVPCLQEDSSTSLYSSAVTRTFYDAMGRATEVLAPASDSAHTIFSFTTYNDGAHTVFSSQPTTIASTSSWVDPSTYTSVPGTITTLDPAGRTRSVQDALGKSSTAAYGLGTQSGDSHTYVTATSTDANGHVSVTYTDALGRTVYTQSDNGKSGGTLTPASLTTTQYNALNLPTSVVVKDMAPQSGQSITSVTTSMQYDDLGRLTTLNDPDRGTHAYTYDGDSHQVADVSGTRTLGTSYDLLGRVGCIQDAVVTPDQHGACTSGANPFVKNTYDADPGGVTWSGTNYAVGRLTQSVAVNYLPSPANTQGSVTQNMQYDARGQLITNRMNIATSGGTLSFPTLPQDQQALSYNDAGQLTTTQTTVGGQAGYTFTQAYDSTTSALKGLSNNSTGVANLATLGYNSQDLVGSINYLTTSGTALASNAFSYDGDLRPSGNSATWQAGGSFSNESLAYDNVGNVTSRATTQAAIPGQSGSGGSDTQNYCYDEHNRLVWAANNGTIPSAGNGTCGSATMSSTLGGNYTARYAYTNLGQLWQGPQNGTGAQEQYLYCDSSHPHQLSNLSQVSSSPTCSSKGTIDYSGSYDAWGNTTSQQRGSTTKSTAYDAQDHLLHWSSSANSQQEWYLYDASGERVLRRSFDGTTTTLTVYAFGLEEHQYAYSGSGSTATNTGNTYYYTLAGRLLGTWDGSSPTTTFLLTDSLGSVVSSFNNPSSGAVMQGNQLYGPYGNQRLKQGSLSTSKGFTGQYNDGLTGLDYYGARYYDPTIGLFLSADPMGGLDAYSYVGGNPESATDPSGLYRIAASGPAGGSSAGYVTPIAGGEGSSPAGEARTNIPTVVSLLPPPRPRVAGAGATLAQGYSPDSSRKPLVTVVHVLRPRNNPFSGGQDSCGGGGAELICMNGAVNYAFYGPGGGTISIPGVLCLACSDIGGGDDYDGNTSRNEEAGTEADTGGDVDPEGNVDGACSGGGLSFIASTNVATAHGEQAIGTLHPGDKVWAYNPSTHKKELQPILHVWINHDNDLVDLTITHTTHTQHGKAAKPSSEVIHTNKKHPFLTVEKGFLPVGKIKPGMHVVEADGQTGVVTGWKVVPGVKTMYNLEVAQDHTFVVGVGQWVVHNCGQGNIRTVSQAISDITYGATDVTVSTRTDAETIFLRKYNGEGYINTTGDSSLGVKNLFGGTEGTYHWDETTETVNSQEILQGHGADNPDAYQRHLQIHFFGGKGKSIHIFFGPYFGP